MPLAAWGLRPCAPKNIASRTRAGTDLAPAEFEDFVDQLWGNLWYVGGFAVAGTLFVFGTIGLAWLITHRTRGDEHKGYPYESGIDTFGDTHGRFGVSFYIYALMFVAFDIEVVFIFLWALIFNAATDPIVPFVSMLIFVAILMLGLAYAWRKGVLSWR